MTRTQDLDLWGKQNSQYPDMGQMGEYGSEVTELKNSFWRQSYKEAIGMFDFMQRWLRQQPLKLKLPLAASSGAGAA